MINDQATAADVDWREHPIRVGTPVFRSSGWKGQLYKSMPEEPLRVFSRHLGCVEGNSTFYSLPSEETIAGWRAQAAPGFAFCFKLPRTISHDLVLRNAAGELEALTRRLWPLRQAAHCGPIFIQMPPHFDATERPVLENFLQGLPAEYDWAIELRHASWFEPETVESLDQFLAERQLNRCWLDASVLFDGPPQTEHDRIARGQKPDVPRLTTSPGTRPIVRLIARDPVGVHVGELGGEEWSRDEHPGKKIADGVRESPQRFVAADVDHMRRIVDAWGIWQVRALEWLAAGQTPFIFIHTPNDAYAFALARLFHERLRSLAAERGMSLPPLPVPPPLEAPRQRSLFDM